MSEKYMQKVIMDRNYDCFLHASVSTIPMYDPGILRILYYLHGCKGHVMDPEVQETCVENNACQFPFTPSGCARTYHVLLIA